MGSTDTENECRVDLKMGMFGGNLPRIHGDEKVFLFLGIDQLDHSFPDKIGEVDLFPVELVDLFGTHQGFSVMEHDEWASCPPAIGVNHHIVVELLVRDVHLS